MPPAAIAAERPSADLDRRLMRATIAYARRNLGRTWPNPAVGALVVRFDDGMPQVIARGVTEAGGRGRPHAERIALAEAGSMARGATLYVTLEPCSHHGSTPPCVEAIIAAGIARVVIAEDDPDTRVAGRGVRILREAGIEVDTGVLADAASRGLAGHFTRMRRGRPYVTLKLAVSADGAIGRIGAGQVAISGAEARGRVHVLRAEHDAILVGIGTALADNPELTVRLPGMADRSPVRLVFDSHAALPHQSRLVSTARQVPVWLVTGEMASRQRTDALREAGVDIVPVPSASDGRIDPRQAFAALAWKNITSVLVEGGATLADELLALDLVDEIQLIRSPVIVGEGAVAAPARINAMLAGETGRFEWIASHHVGADRLHEFRRRLT